MSHDVTAADAALMADDLPRRDRSRRDPVELGALALFSALSLWVLLLDGWQVIAHGRVCLRRPHLQRAF